MVQPARKRVVQVQPDLAKIKTTTRLTLQLQQNGKENNTLGLRACKFSQVKFYRLTRRSEAMARVQTFFPRGLWVEVDF